MKERPILFSAPMVRALLAGTKTQTRRIIKDQGLVEFDEDGDGELIHHHSPRCPGYCDYACDHRCPYGSPGDRLWVRETWYCDHRDCLSGPYVKPPTGEIDLYYRADGEARTQFEQLDPPDANIWKPSIHMPRWASRITLEITDVRVQRLQEISEEDAKAEGATLDKDGFPVAQRPLDDGYDCCRDWYADLWDSINGAHSWDANPWVWALTFKRVPA